MTREEAINRIKVFLHGLVVNKEEREAFNSLIPELRESEDERIRKALIDALKVSETIGELKFRLPYPTREECIAYLEKQKEPLPVPDKFSGLKSLMLQYLQSAANRKDDTEIEEDTDLWGRKILNYVWKQEEKQKPKWGDRDLPQLARVKADGHIVNIHDGQLSNDAKKWIMYGSDEKDGYKTYLPEELEFLSDERPADLSEMMVHKEPYIAPAPTPMVADEQKPVDYEAELKKCKDNPLYFYDKYVSIKQKLAEWSEEDNIGWDEAFACVTRAEKAAKNEEELQNAVTAERWLKEIKFKYCVHPAKQEWSDEDERRSR